MLTITEFNDSLSLALAPITLISGVGLLMICMTNRYNHATNRIRQLMAKREGNIDNSIIRSVIDTEIDFSTCVHRCCVAACSPLRFRLSFQPFWLRSA